jgi:hypothetical protein
VPKEEKIKKLENRQLQRVENCKGGRVVILNTRQRVHSGNSVMEMKTASAVAGLCR